MFNKKPQKIVMKAQKETNLFEIKQALERNIDAELISDTERCIGDMQTFLLVFEKYYFRTNSYASLTILLTENNNMQFADIIASGGGGGIYNLSWGANSNLAEAPVLTLIAHGFEKE